MREELDPQVLQHALADPADEVGLRVRRAHSRQRRGEERDDDEVSVAVSPGTMPSSIASLASGGGASDAAVPKTSAANISIVRPR